jgi:peptidoglycan/LPS O-acetylase OafA/YrhL
MQRGSIPHLAPIDGLRAVAVLSVMIYHLDAGLLPGGFLGVDIFFVISGFVVSGALPPAGISGLRQLLGLFYARRATRILPALYVCLLLSTLLAVIIIPHSWQNDIAERSGLAAVLGYSNFVLAHEAGNYFALQSEYNVFTHTWSLGVEEQFYALFPWLFLPWLTGSRGRSAALFLAGLVLSLGCAYFAAGTDKAAGFYLIYSRFWELALGVLAFQVSSRTGACAAAPWRALASAVCAAIVGFGLAQAAPDRTPYPASLLPCGATAALLVLIRTDNEWRGLRRVLTLPPMIYLGRISYSLYLWHWPIFVLFRWTTGLPGVVPACAASLMTLAAGSASYRFVELPPRRALARGRIAPRTALMAAAILVAIMYPVEQSIWPLRAAISLSTVTRHAADWYPDTTVKTVSSAGCRVRAVQAEAVGIAALELHRSGCPAPAARLPTMFILGDSHAFGYTDLLAEYVRTTGAAGMLYAHGGCAILGQKPNDAPMCDRFIGLAIGDLERRLRPGDVVFLPGLRIARLADWFAVYGEPHARAVMLGAAQAQWRAADLAATVPLLRRIVARGAKVVLEAPKPVFAAPNFRCADWFTKSNPICAGGLTVPRATIEALRAPVLDEFRAAVDAVPGLRVWDPLPILCPGAVCAANDAGGPLFFDADHLSGYGNRKLVPVFEAFLSGLARDRKEGQGSALDPLGPGAPDPIH